MFYDKGLIHFRDVVNGSVMYFPNSSDAYIKTPDGAVRIQDNQYFSNDELSAEVGCWCWIMADNIDEYYAG